MLYTQLRSFHAVASGGGFSEAARRLGLSQPTLTTQVRELETRFNVELFHRKGRRTELTSLGKALFVKTAQYFATEQEAVEVIQSLGSLDSGELRIGAVGPNQIMKMLAAYTRRYPGMRVSVSIRNTHEILEALRDFQVDIGFLSRGGDDNRVVTMPVGSHSLVAFIPCGHPWARHKRIRMRDLHGERMILREVGSNTRRLFEEALAKAGDIRPDIVMEIDNREAVREAVAEGIGIGVIGEHAFTPDPRLATVRIADANVEIESHVACLKERLDSRLIESFLQVATGA